MSSQPGSTGTVLADAAINNMDLPLPKIKKLNEAALLSQFNLRAGAEILESVQSGNL